MRKHNFCTHFFFFFFFFFAIFSVDQTKISSGLYKLMQINFAQGRKPQLDILRFSSNTNWHCLQMISFKHCMMIGMLISTL